MLSLISVVFPVCVMRLESLSAEEGVTARERRRTAIRAFLKASSDTPTPRPPCPPPASAHTKTRPNLTHRHTLTHRLTVNMQLMCAQTRTHTVFSRHTHSHPCPCHRGLFIATVTGPWRPLEEGHTGHRITCPTALVLWVFVFI